MLAKIEHTLESLAPVYSLRDIELEIKIKMSNNFNNEMKTRFIKSFIKRLENRMTGKHKKLYDYRIEKSAVILIVSFYEFNNVKKQEKQNQLKMIL